MNLDQRLPAVRPLDVAPFRNEANELYFALHDSQQIAPQSIAVSAPGYFILAHLDGEHTIDEVQAAFVEQFGQFISAEQIEQMVATLDQALMLESDAFEAAFVARRDEYLAGEVRDNRHRYPPAEELRAELEEIIARGQPAEVESLRGVIAPHLDYARGGPVYADVYATLKQMPVAERYVILGTNHFGRSTGVAATGKDFLTPLGQVATDRAFVEQLEEHLGQGLRAHEFDHNAEHSVELQVHFLQTLYPGAEFRIVPVLCHDPCGPGGTRSYDGNGVDLGDFADALRAAIEEDGARTIVIAGADLSHIGQHFGDEQPTTPEFLEQVRGSDGELLRCLESRQDEQLLECVRTSRNATRVCSTGCIYGLLRALPELPCRVLRYHQAVDMEAETNVTCVGAVIEESGRS